MSSTPSLLRKSGSIQRTGADQWINFTVGSNPAPLCSALETWTGGLNYQLVLERDCSSPLHLGRGQTWLTCFTLRDVTAIGCTVVAYVYKCCIKILNLEFILWKKARLHQNKYTGLPGNIFKGCISLSCSMPLTIGRLGLPCFEKKKKI